MEQSKDKKMVFLCLSESESVEKIKKYADQAISYYAVPVYPLFNYYGNEDVMSELLEHCNEVWIYGDCITDTMKAVMLEADMLDIPLCVKSFSLEIIPDVMNLFHCFDRGYTQEQQNIVRDSIVEGIPFNFVIRDSSITDMKECFNGLMADLDEYANSFSDHWESEI